MGDLVNNQEFMAKAGTWTSADQVVDELFMSAKVLTRPGGNSDPDVRGFIASGAPTPVVSDHWLFGHGGGAAGESTNWTIYRDLDWCGVILGNYDQIDLAGIVDKERKPIVGLA